MRTMIRTTLLCALLIGPLVARGAEFVLQDVRVEGLQRISAGTVFNYLPVSVGSTVNTERYPEIIRALFRTGLFSDVSLERDGDVLVVRVVERPAISEITFTGNRDISTENLRTAMREVGLVEGRVFDRGLLEQVEQALLEQYYARGRYAVRVQTRVRELPRGRVGIDFDISEGLTARIREINIIGNEAFSDDQLTSRFEQTTGTMFSFFTRDNQYSREKLAADLETLRSFYLDRGYLNFAIDSTQVSITPDRRDIYITINITEGQPYTVSSVNLGGELVLPEEDLLPLVSVQPGQPFSRARLNESIRLLAERLGDEGYAFTNVNAVPRINDAEGTVDLDLILDPGRRVYVRRISFSGNTRTQDEVLRREMRQPEGAWFATSAVQRSRERLARLAYLEDVSLETTPVPGTADQVDLEYSVTERRSGSVIFGVGYGQDVGVLVNLQLNESNFLGTGREFNLAFNNSRIDEIYSISYTNPYWTDDGVSRGFRASFEKVDVGRSNAADYVTDRYLALINFGFPTSETDFLRLEGGIDGVKVKTTAGTPQEILDDIAVNGDDYLFYKVLMSWQRDSRNRVVFADRGMLNRVSAEIAIPGSDETFYKLNYRHQSFLPLTDDWVLSFRGDIAYGDGYGDTDSLPFFENYYAGGLRTVRGFKSNTLGPRYSNNEASGGAFRVVGGAEVIFPPPLLRPSPNLRMTAFFDAGNVFTDYDDFDAGEIRYSAGVSGQWLSPLGPLILSVAKPLNKKDGDREEIFQFSFGIPF